MFLNSGGERTTPFCQYGSGDPPSTLGGTGDAGAGRENPQQPCRCLPRFRHGTPLARGYAQLPSVNLFTQVNLDAHLLDLVETGLDFVDVPLLIRENRFEQLPGAVVRQVAG